MDMALKMADVAGFPKRKAESKKRGKLRGLGMSNTIERAAAASFEGAEIRFDRGGTVSIFSGSINQGQGHETTFKQVVADKLGVHPNDIQYIQGDTDKVFFGEGTGGSRSATMSGAAFHNAGEKVITKAKAIAAHNMKVDAADVNFNEGIFSSTKSNQTMTIKDVALAAFNPAKIPNDMEAGLYATAVYKADVENFPNGVHVCEIEVDPDTGKSEIVRYNVVDDVGTVMNPLLLKGQIVGGVAMGVGQILKEDIHFDSEGQLTTGSFMDYAMPRAHDFPMIEVKANPVPTKTNPLGVKGAGEAGCVGGCRRWRTRWWTRSPSLVSSTSQCQRRRRWCGARLGMARGNKSAARNANVRPERHSWLPRQASSASGAVPSRRRGCRQVRVPRRLHRPRAG